MKQSNNDTKEIILLKEEISKLNEKFLDMEKYFSKKIKELGCESIRLSHDQEGLEDIFKKLKKEFINLKPPLKKKSIKNKRRV